VWKDPLGVWCVKLKNSFVNYWNIILKYPQGLEEPLGYGVEREKWQVCQTEIAELVSKQGVI
jgi:hypothetical protein